MNRRGFLRLGIGVAAAIAAPALVSRANIMAVKAPKPDPFIGWDFGADDTGSWLIIHPDAARAMERALRESADFAACPPVELIRGEQGLILGGHRVIEVADIRASNYGRGPGLLTEDEFGVRRWTPETEAVRLTRAKVRQAERDLRRILEPRGGRRWV